jgi:hypothetical protein
MDAAPLTPREEDEVGSSPAFSHLYRITVEEANGSTHEHEFLSASRHLALGDVIEAGQEGWDGPRVAIEEIDRHPDAKTPGAALAWPQQARLRHRPVQARPKSAL